MNSLDYDFVIIGSGFGGSVCALRLSQKGYKVLVVEKGKWYRAADFARTNWQFSRWLWVPVFRWFGIMKISIFRHVGIVSGTGVGGGSLVYANVLEIPKRSFFTVGNWAKLADWQTELKPFYKIAQKMLGATVNPKLFESDKVLRQVSDDLNKSQFFKPTEVGVYFGEPGQRTKDPYFKGKGPDRSGCIFCGGCMTGCRHNAKNTLDKNYLYLARECGATILPEQEVYDVRPIAGENGSAGYELLHKSTTRIFRRSGKVTARGVIFSGGVLGTVKLLLKLKKTSLPDLSERIGDVIRTNNESLISITSSERKRDLSEGIAIGSILQTDNETHLELCRYGSGSGAWRLSLLPLPEGKTFMTRMLSMFIDFIRNAKAYVKILFIKDWAKNSVIMLFMQTTNTTLKFRRNRLGRTVTNTDGKKSPVAFNVEAHGFARSLERIIEGKAMVFGLMPFLNAPVTAHILGGAIMGSDPNEGVVDKNNRVFGYKNMFVCDGSAISSNPGVNPALTITAVSERAMSKIPHKGS